jgi:hypothetical protein
MGTFHPDRGPLHGMTVVVETTGPETWVGRCDTADEQAVVLLDADVHRAGDEAAGSREDFLARAAAVGVWSRHRRVAIPRGRVAALRRLGEV